MAATGYHKRGFPLFTVPHIRYMAKSFRDTRPEDPKEHNIWKKVMLTVGHDLSHVTPGFSLAEFSRQAGGPTIKKEE